MSKLVRGWEGELFDPATERGPGYNQGKIIHLEKILNPKVRKRIVNRLAYQAVAKALSEV